MSQQSFDFSKHNVDAKKILVQVWDAIQGGITKPGVLQLNSKFISAEILAPTETGDCTTSYNLLQLLHSRNNEQIATALNIICDEPVHKGIREAVKAAFTHQLPVTEQTNNRSVSLIETSKNNKASESLSMGEIVITDERQVKLVIESLKKDSTLVGRWKILGIEMGMDPAYLKALNDRWTMGMITNFDEVLTDIIQKWISKEEPRATVAALCNILHSNDMIFCEDRIKQAFSQSQ